MIGDLEDLMNFEKSLDRANAKADDSKKTSNHLFASHGARFAKGSNLHELDIKKIPLR